VDKIEEDGKLKGVVFQKNKMVDGKLIAIKEDTFVLDTPLLISSIGSLPETIAGLPYQYSMLEMVGENGCRVAGFSNVFAIGNAITGKGNIRESKKHGVIMTNRIIDDHLQKDDFLEEWLSVYNENIKEEVKDQIEEMTNDLLTKDALPEKIIQNILRKTKAIEKKLGYTTYKEWIKAKTPVRLENMK